MPREEYDQRSKGFVAVKKAMENKLLGSKKHIRAKLIDRTQLQVQDSFGDDMDT